MGRHARTALLVAVAALLGWGSTAGAQTFRRDDGGLAAFTPRVPVSALARPAAWFNPARLHVATSISVGSGFGGTGALQVTSFSYRFAAPVWVNVSLGNAWGLGQSRTGSSFFLEGFDVGCRPLPSVEVQVRYRDFRSPLQLRDPFFGY